MKGKKLISAILILVMLLGISTVSNAAEVINMKK